MSRFDSILATVGRTPVVRIQTLAPAHAQLFVKLEAFNPMGSVKDRLALGIIEDAERSGRLKPGQTVIEATSGNTGIGLAMVCARKGYPLVVVMGENFSVERRKMMRFLGAKVILTPAGLRGSGMLSKAMELAQHHGWFLCRQFENDANADTHSRTTAVEILEDFADLPLDYWVSSFGTGGTLKGVARTLKQRSPRTRIVACEPDNSPLLSSGVAQPQFALGTPPISHPLARPHPMQGMAPDFISKLTQDALAAGLIDRIVAVNGADAMRYSRELARREGIFTGISGGAAFAAAMTVCSDAPPGSTVLCMLPDTGERYQSTPLFADIAAEMDEEELEIAKSTPNFRFDVPQTAAPQAATAPPPLTPQATAFVADVLANKEQPVVMFALEWCEFCWAVRKLFARHKIAYRSIDLDSVDYQKDNWGGQIRAALTARTSIATIPQVFIGGQLIGGATDVIQGWKQGHTQQRLESSGVSYDATINTDPYSFLPGWLQPR